MSPTLGAWLLQAKGKQFKTGSGKNSLGAKELTEILLPEEAGKAVTRDLEQSALRQYMLVMKAKQLSRQNTLASAAV